MSTEIECDMPITKDNSTEDIAAKLTNPTFRLARRPFEENNSSYLPTVDTMEFIRKEETQVLNPFYRRHHLEKRSVRCNYCKALMYVEESSVGSKKMNTLKFSVCCAKGKVNLPPANPLPDLIMDNLTNQDKENKEGQQFRCNILLFNNLLSLTTNVSAVDQDLLSNRGGNYTFRINGQIHGQLTVSELSINCQILLAYVHHVAVVVVAAVSVVVAVVAAAR